jgi:PAS domain S-box-containing protein
MNETTAKNSGKERYPSILNPHDGEDGCNEGELDGFAQLAARLSGCSIAVISLKDKNRNRIKSSFGIDANELLKESSQCTYALHNREKPTVIPDTRKIKSFQEKKTKFLFYAGLPLISPSGFVLGSLCVMDYQPSQLSEEQLHSLELLAGQVVALLEARKKQLVLKESYGMLRDAERMRKLEKINNEALINNTSDDIWSIDKDYRLIAFNRAFSEKMKYLTGETISQGSPALYPDKIPADMHQQFKGYFDRALSGESFAEEYSRPEKLKDGMLIWIELNGHPIYQDGEIKGAAFFARTITKRKQAELKIRESEANYRMLFEHSPLPKILLEMDTLQIIMVNQAALALYGYQKEEMVGRNFNLLHKEEEDNTFYENLHSFKEKETKVQNVSLQNKSGEFLQGELMVHQLVYQGKNCLLAMFNDQTEQLKTRSIKSQLATILENSLNEIYIFNTQDLKFLYVNRGAILNMGYSMDEIRQLTPYHIKPEFDEARFRAYLQPLEKEETEKLVFVTVHKRKNGTRYPVEVHLQKMWYEGQPAFVAIIIDITEAKSAEKQMLELNMLLEKSNLELEQFASTTAHDLQEPLRMVSAFTSMLEKHYAEKLDKKGLKYIHFAKDGAIRMQQMIKDILEYSKAGGVDKKMELLPLNQILEDVVNDLQRRIQATKAKVNIPETDVLLHANKNSLYRLFLNLISNSLKFVPKGRVPEITIKLNLNSNQFRFSIEDNGIGIAPDHLSQLFRPFNRLHRKEEFEGTGLGLATCKKIVEHHKGDIWVTSQPGEGSQFHFTLPKRAID